MFYLKTRKLAPTVLLLVAFGLSIANVHGDIVSIGASKDNTMFEANTGKSNGAGSYFFAGRTGINNGGLLHRALIAFDIAGNIPAGATIDSVSLSLNLSQTVSGDQQVSLNLLEQD